MADASISQDEQAEAAVPTDEGPVVLAPSPEIEPDPPVAPQPAPLSASQAFGRALESLDKLTSYRFRTSVLLYSEEAGEPEAGSLEMSGAIAASDRMHLKWVDLDEDHHVEIIILGDQAWLYDGDQWEDVPVLLAETMWQGMSFFAPWATWPALLADADDAVFVGTETVHGIPCHHYRTSSHGLGEFWEGVVSEASADLWIAEAGHPVRYAYTAAGVGEDGDSFSISWAMDLTHVGQEIVIQAPE